MKIQENVAQACYKDRKANRSTGTDLGLRIFQSEGTDEPLA